jgi:hypothetical protein
MEVGVERTWHLEHICHRFSSDIREEDVAWVIQLFDSRAQLEWCAPMLRKHYPQSRVVLISDGDGETYEDIAALYQFQYIRGEHLMRLDTAHLYVERLLTALIEGPERYCFRIDPDTKIWRRLKSLPSFTSIFGTLETVSEGLSDEIAVPANVQGGCIGFTKDAVEQLLSSGFINRHTCVTNWRDTWARCLDMVDTAQNGRLSDDFIISWAAYQTGIPIVESSEIRSRWRRTITNEDVKYAITHPHKLPVLSNTKKLREACV